MIKILNTQELAGEITRLGLPVDFIKHTVSPTSVYYHFRLQNPLDLPKVKKTTQCLAAEINKVIKVEHSSCGSFCLSVVREHREYPLFTQYHNVLKGKEPGEILFGINQQGEPLTMNIRHTKSLLVAGSSGGGKSVCLSNIICSLICYTKPEECGLLLIDLKRCEFEMFKNSKHLVKPVQFDYNGALESLYQVKQEISNRYERMQKEGIRKATVDKYPLLVVMIDEYAQLACEGNKTELDKIVGSIASTGRACNVFLIIATQHAVSSIISNTIKANLQSVIGLRTKNIAQSTCIINSRDCVDLLGYGDSYMEFDGVPGLQRIQVCNISDQTINDIMREQNELAKQQPSIQKSEKKPKLRLRDRIFNFLTSHGIKIGRKGMRPSSMLIGTDLNYADCCVDDDR